MTTVHKFAFIPLYLFSSLVSTLLNKHITTTLEFHPTFLLLLMQSVIIVALLMLLKTINVCTFVLELRHMFYWIPSAVSMVLMIFSGLRALSHLSISMFTLFKNYSVIVIAVLELLLLGRTISRLSVLCFAMMIVSGMLVDYSETRVDRVGYAWICTNVVASAVYVIVLRMTIVHHIRARQREAEKNTRRGDKKDAMVHSPHDHGRKCYVDDEGIAATDRAGKELLRRMLRVVTSDETGGAMHPDTREMPSGAVCTTRNGGTCTAPVIVFCNEAARKVRNNRIGDYVRMFEGLDGSQSEHTSPDGGAGKNAQAVDAHSNRETKKKDFAPRKKGKQNQPNDFESLMYSQILSIPFLFLLSLLFDNYASISSFKRVLENDVLSSPDYMDTLLLNMEKVTDLAVVHNILIIKAFIGDLLELSGSAYFDDRVFLFIALSGLSVFFVALSTVWCLRSLSSTTLSMMGATNKIVVGMSGVFLGERIGVLKAMSIVVGGMASILYVETIRKE